MHLQAGLLAAFGDLQEGHGARNVNTINIKEVYEQEALLAAALLGLPLQQQLLDHALHADHGGEEQVTAQLQHHQQLTQMPKLSLHVRRPDDSRRALRTCENIADVALSGILVDEDHEGQQHADQHSIPEGGGIHAM